jgi:hypothetical protein
MERGSFAFSPAICRGLTLLPASGCNRLLLCVFIVLGWLFEVANFVISSILEIWKKKTP